MKLIEIYRTLNDENHPIRQQIIGACIEQEIIATEKFIIAVIKNILKSENDKNLTINMCNISDDIIRNAVSTVFLQK